jgi:hypothetical protein
MKTFPDVEKAVSHLIETELPQYATYRATDADVSDQAPLFIVERTGTVNVKPWEDTAQVSVTALGLDRDSAILMNRLLTGILNGRVSGNSTPYGNLDSIYPLVLPNQVPDPDTSVRVVPSTWTVSSRIQEISS